MTVHYPITLGKDWSSRPSTESNKFSAVSCFGCFLAAGHFDFPNFLYSQRIALLCFEASSRNSSSLNLDCATIADIILILMIGTHFLSCSNPSPPFLIPAWEGAAIVVQQILSWCQKH